MRFLFPLALLKLSLSCVGGDDESEIVEAETVEAEIVEAETVEAETDDHQSEGPPSSGVGAVGETWTGSSGYEMAWIPAGSFTMGSPSSEPDRYDDEVQHRVELTRGFWMGTTEVTQGLWQSVMGSNPSSCEYRVPVMLPLLLSLPSRVDLCEPNYPVQNVSWYDAVKFANALSEREGLESCYQISGEDVRWSKGLDCAGYRLPTEAEWEYAGRAGEHELFAGAESYRAVCEVGNVGYLGAPLISLGASKRCTDKHYGLAPVGSYRANALGLYDMTGNVWEWTWDRHGWSYATPDATDPVGPNTNSYRVRRGGGWFFAPRFARLANRGRRAPSYRRIDLGLRLARSNP